MNYLRFFEKWTILALLCFFVVFGGTTPEAHANNLLLGSECTLLAKQCGKGLACEPSCGGGTCSYIDGSRKLGQGCGSWYDCAKGLACKGLVCAGQLPRKHGQLCPNSWKCKKNLVCVEGDRGSMLCLRKKHMAMHIGSACKGTRECTNSFCYEGTCRAYSFLGMKCIFDEECAPGTTCLSGKCAPKLTAGKKCTQNYECKKGLFCKNTNKSSTCTAPGYAKLTESCEKEPCKSGLICLTLVSSKQCVYPSQSRGVGQSCSSLYEGECKKWHKCSRGKCIRHRTQMASCKLTVECPENMNCRKTAQSKTKICIWESSRQGSSCMYNGCKKGLMCQGRSGPHNGLICYKKRWSAKLHETCVSSLSQECKKNLRCHMSRCQKVPNKPTTKPVSSGEKCWKRNCKMGLMCIITPTKGPRCISKKLLTEFKARAPRDFLKISKDWCASIEKLVRDNLIRIGKEVVEGKTTHPYDTFTIINWRSAYTALGCTRKYPYNKQ